VREHWEAEALPGPGRIARAIVSRPVVTERVVGLLPVERARRAIAHGNVRRARRIGEHRLRRPGSIVGGWDRANRLHWGHVIVGLANLADGRVAEAESHLLAASSCAAALGGSPQLNSFGPDFSLAAQVLAQGRTTSVLVYLDECSKFWRLGAGVLDAWASAIRRGEMPNMRQFAQEP
jgi:hypothetical protein